ncbi:cell division protein FtsW [Paraphotobacterium marinum]|uniref:Probable peptidoglycan glycosyltransferase FtsW n=1 Tax=Paraphotobacterium marinum TaxID=1755811 RepID=A0A220VC07_9GAMM|nr:cell division protein FtsW [Paraphotobacterium marinum]
MLQKFFLNTVPKKKTSSNNLVLYDRQLVWLSILLMAVGLIIVSSASEPVSMKLFDEPFYFTIHQGSFALLALLLSFFILNIPMYWWHQISGIVLLVALFLLLVVIFVGSTVNGASRWIPLGVFNFQPAEFAKLSLFLFLSGYLVRRHEQVQESFYGFLKPLIVLGVMGILLLAQPDFGSFVVMMVTTIGMLFIAGAKLWQFLALICVAVLSVISLVLLEPYRMERVTAFMDPWADPFGSGYQLTQSLMAFGRGGWFGQGLGNSVIKLQYLPEAHTDFIMSILGEEMGFVGVLIVLILLLTLVMKAIYIGKKSLDKNMLFNGYLSFGIGFWFAFQTLVNIGAAAGMIPPKGLTLPLISYGGSSLIIMSVAIAMLIRIDHERRVNFKVHG